MLESSQSDNEMSRNDDSTGQDLPLVTQLTQRVNVLDEKVSQQLPPLTKFIESCGASVESLEMFKEESLVSSRQLADKMEQIEILCKEKGLSAQTIDNIASEIQETTQHIVADPEIENKLKELETQLTAQINSLKESTQDSSEIFESIMDEYVSKENLNEQVSEIKAIISTERDNQQIASEQNAELQSELAENYVSKENLNEQVVEIKTLISSERDKQQFASEQNAQLQSLNSENYVSKESLNDKMANLERSIDESYVEKASLNEEVEKIASSLTESYVSKDVIDNKVSGLQSYMMNRLVSKETFVQNVETLEESLKLKLEAFKESLPEQSNPFEALKPKLDTLFQTLGGLKTVLTEQGEKAEAYKSDLLAQIESNSQKIKSELVESVQGVEDTLTQTELNIREVSQAIIDQKVEEMNSKLNSSLIEMSDKLGEKELAFDELVEVNKVSEERFVTNETELLNLQNKISEIKEEQNNQAVSQTDQINELENRITETVEQQAGVFDIQKEEINSLQTRMDESIENQSNILNKMNIEAQEQVEFRDKLEFTSEEQLLQQKELKEGANKISILLSRIEGLEKELENSKENMNNDQMVIKSNFEDISDKSEQLSCLMQDISEELNTHKETITEKSGMNEESITSLQEKMSSIIVEKNNLYSMLENSKEEFKNQNIKLTQDIENAVKKNEEGYREESVILNKRINEMQSKSETALQLKSDELNELGKKYSDVQSMRNTLETNINDIKDARDDHQLFSNRLDGWMNMQEKKYKLTSACTAAAIFLIGCFAFIKTESDIQNMDHTPQNIAINNTEETKLSIEDSEVIVDSVDVIDESLSDDLDTDDGIITSSIIEEDVIEDEAVLQPEQSPRVETAFAKTEETVAENKSIEYIVKKNDNLWGIAKRFYKKGHLNKKIIEDNKLSSPEIKPGDVLRIYL